MIFFSEAKENKSQTPLQIKFSLPQDSRLYLHPDAGPDAVLELWGIDGSPHVGAEDVHVLFSKALVTN